MSWAHIQPALTAAVTIDHVFSISAALVGGLIWSALGFQNVFLMGAGLAVINFFYRLAGAHPPAAGGTDSRGKLTSLWELPGRNRLHSLYNKSG